MIRHEHIILPIVLTSETSRPGGKKKKQLKKINKTEQSTASVSPHSPSGLQRTVWVRA